MPVPKKYRQYFRSIRWKAIRKSILNRAGDYCEVCGVANHLTIRRWSRNKAVYIKDNTEFPKYMGTGRYLSPIKVVLTIAHLDHNPDNEGWNNLRALCQLCHNRHDAKHRAKSRERTRRMKNAA